MPATVELSVPPLRKQPTRAGSSSSVRATEELVRRLKLNPHPLPGKRPQQPDLLLSSLEEQLQKRFQSRVAIRKTGAKAGKLEIHFSDADELTRIIDLLEL